MRLTILLYALMATFIRPIAQLLEAAEIQQIQMGIANAHFVFGQSYSLHQPHFIRKILFAFLQDNGYRLTGRTEDENNDTVKQLHALTGIKPRLVTKDGVVSIWRK